MVRVPLSFMGFINVCPKNDLFIIGVTRFHTITTRAQKINLNHFVTVFITPTQGDSVQNWVRISHFIKIMQILHVLSGSCEK